MKKFAVWLCTAVTMALLSVPVFAWGDVQTVPTQPANGLTVSRGMSIGILLVIIASAIMMVVSLVTVIMTYKTYSKMSDDKKEALDEQEQKKKKAKKAKQAVEEDDEEAEEDIEAEFQGDEEAVES